MLIFIEYFSLNGLKCKLCIFKFLFGYYLVDDFVNKILIIDMC